MKILPVFLAFCTGAFFAEWVRQRQPNPPSESRSSTFVEATPSQNPARSPRDSDAVADLTPIQRPARRETPATTKSPATSESGTRFAGKGGSIPLTPVTNPAETEPAKFFRVSIVSQSKSGMVATGKFYDPEYIAKPGEIQRLPKYRNPLNQTGPPRSDWQATKDIVIRGLTGVAEGDEWSGMLVRDGTATYSLPNSEDRTTAAYRLSNAPIPYFPPENPRAWMWK